MKFSLVLLAVLPFIHAAPTAVNNSPALANRDVALKLRSVAERTDANVDVAANVNVANIAQAEAQLKIALGPVLAGLGSNDAVSAVLDLIVSLVDNLGVVPTDLGDLGNLPNVSGDLLSTISATLDGVLAPLGLGGIVPSVISSLEGLLHIDVGGNVDVGGVTAPVIGLLQSLDSLIGGFNVGGTVKDLNSQLSQITSALDGILAQITGGSLDGIDAGTLTTLLQSIIQGLFNLLAGATNPLLSLGAATSVIAALGKVLSTLGNTTGLSGVVHDALTGLVLPTVGGLLTGLLLTLLSTVLGAVGGLNLPIGQ